jgi:2-polyprenyl-6-methoxyphenol hydroxylase-like FAD-dependent oxidoreductase
MIKNVLVSGASIAGPAAAFWLARYGMNVTVVEKTDSLRGGGYPIDIRGSAVEVVKRMGLYERLKLKHVDTRSLEFVDERGERIAIVAPEDIAGGERGSDIEIRRGDLAAALYEATRDTVTYRFSDSVEKLEEKDDGVEVRFVNGDAAKYDIVIGADGLHSNVRSLVFGHEHQFERYLGFCFAGFTMPNSFCLAHGGTNYTVLGKWAGLFAPGETDRVFGLLVFRYPESPFKTPISDDDKRELTARMFKDEKNWHVPLMVDAMLEADDLFFDAVSQIRMPTWSSGRIVLTGDSAHATSFLSGQGSSCALVSAYVLAGELVVRGSYQEAFASYERTVRPFIEGNQDLVSEGLTTMMPKTQEELDARNSILRGERAADTTVIEKRKADRHRIYNAIDLPNY